jgi:hypothetical protein
MVPHPCPAEETNGAEAEEDEPARGAEADRGIAPIEAGIGDYGHESRSCTREHGSLGGILAN